MVDASANSAMLPLFLPVLFEYQFNANFTKQLLSLVKAVNETGLAVYLLHCQCIY
jgi:hypothetical protein